MKLGRLIGALVSSSGLLVHPVQASDFPVEVQSCNQTLVFNHAPQRAVAHDQNISEMMFALDLQPNMVGISGISGWYKMTPELQKQIGDLPELAPKNPTMENLLAADLDFLFAGWYYGMKPGGEVTPATLAEYDVPVYTLTESCAHLRDNPPTVTMETMYVDVENIGKIFGVAEKAKTLTDQWREQVAAIQAAVERGEKPRVFLYDSGEEKPFTAGKYAIANAMIEAAGGSNIMNDVGSSWTRVGWEAVADRNPEFIILLDYQDEAGWKKLWNFLESFPPMAETDAVRNKRFLPLKYTEITPGPANIQAIEKLAKALHPHAF